MEGCIYGHTAVVYALIQAGANLALENQPGFRAQTLAVKRGNNTIADALETAGNLSIYPSIDEPFHNQ